MPIPPLTFPPTVPQNTGMSPTTCCSIETLFADFLPFQKVKNSDTNGAQPFLQPDEYIALLENARRNRWNPTSCQLIVVQETSPLTGHASLRMFWIDVGLWYQYAPCSLMDTKTGRFVSSLDVVVDGGNYLIEGRVFRASKLGGDFQCLFDIVT
ncbi:hypothetical protein BC830DRAFT_542984 [Chytriomyces sp. MP71]|nr:hypothetical protein BC830DRAFT_542984 [Chytriomyces sp. MP71]